MKMKNARNIVKLAVCAIGIIGVFQGNPVVKADEPVQVVTYSVMNEAQFELKDGVIVSYKGNKEASEIVIPSMIGNQMVIGINQNVFEKCAALETVIIPDSITKIESRAFAECDKLSTMYSYSSRNSLGQVEMPETGKYVMDLPEKLTELAEDAFVKCPQIKSFSVPANNTVFKTYSVNADNTEKGELLMSKDGSILYRMAPDTKDSDDPQVAGNGNYTLPNTVTEIRAYAIEGNMGGGRRYIIPTSVKKIGNYAFYQCNNLNGIEFVSPSAVEEIGDFAFSKNQNISTDPKIFTLPESVKKIGESCFKDCVNMEIDISKTSIESIPQFIFFGCQNIHDVTLPKTLKYLEAYAFVGCDNLNHIVFLGESLDKIGTGAFQGCNNLYEIDVPEGVKAIENDTFDGCWNLEKIILPDSVNMIGDNAFKDCKNIKEMVIPKNVSYIANSSFTGAKQDKIDTSKNEYAQGMIGGLPAKGEVIIVHGVKYKVTKSDASKGMVTTIGVVAKKLTKATVADTVKKGGYTFTVTEISKNAFKKCTKMKSVVIGKNVTKIGANAFNGDKKLAKITVKSSKLKSVGKNAVKGIKKNATIKVPKKKLKKYKGLFKKKTGFKTSMKIKK